MADRPKVGPADPATIHAAIERARHEAIAEAKLGMYKAGPSAKTKPMLGKNLNPMLSGLPAIGMRKRQIEDAVDEATGDPSYLRRMRAVALRNANAPD